MIDERVPFFVCKCCGSIIRAVAFEETDVYLCRICNAEMFRTSYTMNDLEYNSVFSDYKSSFDFRNRIFDEYVLGNELYSNEMHKKRLSEESESFNRWLYGYSGELP